MPYIVKTYNSSLCLGNILTLMIGEKARILDVVPDVADGDLSANDRIITLVEEDIDEIKDRENYQRRVEIVAIDFWSYHGSIQEDLAREGFRYLTNFSIPQDSDVKRHNVFTESVDMTITTHNHHADVRYLVFFKDSMDDRADVVVEEKARKMII